MVTGIVGCAGLLPTVAAIKAKKDICLANKETLIAGGCVGGWVGTDGTQGHGTQGEAHRRLSSEQEIGRVQGVGTGEKRVLRE